MKTVALISLLLLPVFGIAQTVTLVNASISDEAPQGVRFIVVDATIQNDEKIPIVVDSRSFYLSGAKGHLPSISHVDGADTLFSIQLNPGFKVSKRLWFQVSDDIDAKKLELCLHAPENETWDDYVQIPFSAPVPATETAPMWHPAQDGDLKAPRAYSVHMLGKPPKLKFAPDPKFPLGKAEHQKAANEKVLVGTSMIVDSEGHPQQIWLVTPAGLGFDAEALRTVSQYRFKPSLDRNGAPIAVEVRIEINFRAD